MKKIENNSIKYADIVEEHNIESYDELLNIIRGMMIIILEKISYLGV